MFGYGSVSVRIGYSLDSEGIESGGSRAGLQLRRPWRVITLWDQFS